MIAGSDSNSSAVATKRGWAVAECSGASYVEVMLADLGTAVMICFGLFVAFGFGVVLLYGVTRLPDLWMRFFEAATPRKLRGARSEAVAMLVPAWAFAFGFYALVVYGIPLLF